MYILIKIYPIFLQCIFKETKELFFSRFSVILSFCAIIVQKEPKLQQPQYKTLNNSWNVVLTFLKAALDISSSLFFLDWYILYGDSPNTLIIYHLHSECRKPVTNTVCFIKLFQKFTAYSLIKADLTRKLSMKEIIVTYNKSYQLYKTSLPSGCLLVGTKLFFVSSFTFLLFIFFSFFWRRGKLPPTPGRPPSLMRTHHHMRITVDFCFISANLIFKLKCKFSFLKY